MLSNIDILKEMDDGNIVIEPFNKAQLQTNSYDVCLGNWVVRERTFVAGTIIPYNSRAGARVLWCEPEASAGLIYIGPYETLLCHTQEVIGGRNTVTTEMRAKSTTARFGISVCKCAGLGDVGFISRWTMEMTNHMRHPVTIPTGEAIAQILFHKVSKVTEPYVGRYGQGDWSPDDMLPKGKRP